MARHQQAVNRLSFIVPDDTAAWLGERPDQAGAAGLGILPNRALRLADRGQLLATSTERACTLNIHFAQNTRNYHALNIYTVTYS